MTHSPTAAQPSTILITGARYGIGAALLEHVRSQRGGKLRAIASEPDDEALATLQADALATYLSANAVDVVVHCAEVTDRETTRANASLTVSTNVTAPLVVARACSLSGTKMAYVTTPSTDAPSLFQQTKQWGMEACAQHAAQGLQILSVRDCYGPQIAPGNARSMVADFALRALRGNPIAVFTGHTVMPCYVDDVAAAIVRCISSNEWAQSATELATGRGHFGIGNPADPLAVEALAQAVCEACEVAAELQLISLDDSVADISPDRAAHEFAKTTELGWRPQTSLSAGLNAVAEWVRKTVRTG